MLQEGRSLQDGCVSDKTPTAPGHGTVESVLLARAPTPGLSPAQGSSKHAKNRKYWSPASRHWSGLRTQFESNCYTHRFNKYLLGTYCWTARRSNQSILKEVNLNIHWKDWYWSWSSNTLATWCKELGHRERLRAGGEGDNRGWDWYHQAQRLDGITNSMNMSLSKLWGMVKDREASDAALHGVIKSWTRLRDSTTTMHQAFFMLDLWCWTNWHLSSKRLKSRNLVGGSTSYTTHNIQPALAEGCPELTDERLVKWFNVSCPGCAIYTVAG